MNKPSVKHLIIICSIVLLSLIIILLFQIRNEKKLSRCYLSMVDVDYDISSGMYAEALNKIKASYSLVYNSKTALMFLKRLDRLSGLTSGYTAFSEYSSELSSRFKRDTEIAAVAAYAAQKTGDYEESLKISEARLSKTDYSAIHMINLLNTDRGSTAGEISDRYSGAYGFIFSGGELTVEVLLDKAADLDDQRFLLDAALIKLSEGDPDSAWKIISGADNPAFDELKSFIAYERGDYKAALNYFRRLQSRSDEPGMMLFEAELLLRNDSYDQAGGVYENFIKRFPDYSSLPYRNLYAINYNYEVRKRWLSDGLDLFPQDRDLLLSSAWEMYQGRDYSGSAEILSDMDEDDSSVGLFRLNMMLTGRSPEHVIGNFWTVYNESPDSEAAAVSFANFLLKNKQYEQLETLLKRYTDAAGIRGWVYCYSAVSDAMRGQYGAAEANINKALELEENVTNYYNKAEILSLEGRYSEADENLQKALLISETSDRNEKDIEKVYFKLAETRYNTGDYDGAEAYIRRLKAVNPDDMKGSLLLKKIQDKYYD